jgi:hypothetical protein
MAAAHCGHSHSAIDALERDLRRPLRHRIKGMATMGFRFPSRSKRTVTFLSGLNTWQPARAAETFQYPEAPLASENTPSSRHKVENQNDQRHHQQKVNQTTGYVEAEAQQPQNENDHKNCPEHRHLLAILLTPEK